MITDTDDGLESTVADLGAQLADARHFLDTIRPGRPLLADQMHDTIRRITTEADHG